MKEQFNVPIIGEGMKHETEINYVKNKIAKLEVDFAGFAALLIQAGIVVVDEIDGQQVFKVNKVKVEEVQGEGSTDGGVQGVAGAGEEV